MSTIEELVRQLPHDLQGEVEDFARFLLEKRAPHTSGKVALTWRGALRDDRDKFTSVELQHNLRESWGD